MHWTVSITVCPKVSNYVAASLGNDIYFFGGNGKLIEVYKLDTLTLEWNLLPRPIDENGIPLTYPEVPSRNSFSVVTHNDTIYLWGGCNDPQLHKQLYCFDPIAKHNSWTRPNVTGCIPTRVGEHLACVANNRMYVFRNGRLKHDIHCLKFETMEWTYVQTTGELPVGRELHWLDVIHNRIYIFGELNNHGYFDFTWRPPIYFLEIFYLDLKTNRWHCPLINGGIPAENCPMFSYKGFIYIVGGIDGYKPRYLHTFDPMANSLQPMEPHGNPPSAMELQMCVVVGSRVFFFGESILYNYIHVLDFEPSLKTLCILGVIENCADLSCLPRKLKNEVNKMVDRQFHSRLNKFVVKSNN